MGYTVSGARQIIRLVELAVTVTNISCHTSRYKMTHRKPHLPEKICQHCQRPFSWRRKWWRCWDEVRFCSQACKRAARRQAKPNDCAAGSVEDEFR